MKPHAFKVAFIVFGFGLFFAVPAAHAVVVAQYDFAGGLTASSDADSSVAGSFGGSGGGLFSSGTGTAYFLVESTTNSETGAVTGGDYFSFTITPEAGTTIKLTTLSFDLGGTSNNNAAFSVFAFVRTGLNSFTTTVGSPSPSTTAVPQAATGSTFVNTSVDLSALISIAGTTEIRIYLYDTSSSGSVSRIDNVILSADVTAIPEPSSYALAFGAFAGLLALRRRRAV